MEEWDGATCQEQGLSWEQELLADTVPGGWHSQLKGKIPLNNFTSSLVPEEVVWQVAKGLEQEARMRLLCEQARKAIERFKGEWRRYVRDRLREELEDGRDTVGERERKWAEEGRKNERREKGVGRCKGIRATEFEGGGHEVRQSR